MDLATFSRLLQEIKQKPFAKDKKEILQRYSQHYFSAQQCVGVLNDFAHASDKVEALTIIAPRLVTLNGEDAKTIVKAFTFANNQVQALRLIASHIYDPANKYTIVDAFTFSSNKDEARQILDTAVFAGAAPPSVTYGVSCSHHGAPYQPPAQNPVYNPPPPNPGAYPPPPQGVYPPPAQAGNYPGQPVAGYPAPPGGGYNVQFGMGGHPPPQQPTCPPPGAADSVNVQFGVGGFPGMPTGNISFNMPPPWP